MKLLRFLLQILPPLAILAFGALLFSWIVNQKTTPRIENKAFAAPRVRTHTVTLDDIRIDVHTQGTVEPFRSIDLAAQVGGRVVAVSPALRAGGFFAAGEVLVQIEATDYELAIVQHEAAVARAQLRLLQEKAEAEAAMRAWQELEGESPAEPLVTRQPQINEAEKALAAARALHARSVLDLQRTKILAPFAGRVRSAKVDVGQIVQPGSPIADIYGTDCAEVRLPLPASDAAFLDLPLHWRNATAGGTPPQVDLTAEFGGQPHSYRGEVLRTEGEVDRKTRQLVAIARVADPYAQSEQLDRPPLAVGTFVQATIHGRTFAAVAVIPRSALRGRDEVWVVDAEHRLHRRRIEVMHATTDLIYVQAGLTDGEVVCTTPLDAPVDGMPVRLFEAEQTQPSGSQPSGGQSEERGR
ncbi:MAG: efflux RND transporter periplasmic adaptor subunit [Planctomycetes bacterium]|nr:efflux RND transporter periplasmic adaptor subunit [Planctomycetota bacterium]